MSTMILLAILGVAALLGAWLVHLRNGAARGHRSSPYHAVELRTGASCCNGVRAMAARRFLSREAPWLPLPGCTAAVCTCRYVHFDDRRAGPRRDAMLPQGNGLQSANRVERRRGRGRRKEDQRRLLDEFELQAAIAERRRRRARGEVVSALG